MLPFIAAEISAGEDSSVNAFTLAPFLMSVWTISSNPVKKMFKKKISDAHIFKMQLVLTRTRQFLFYNSDKCLPLSAAHAKAVPRSPTMLASAPLSMSNFAIFSNPENEM